MEAFNWASSAEIMMTELEMTIKDKDAVLVNGTNSITGKVRRRRTVYSRSHLDLLLKTFETNPYPGISVREKLSRLTGVHESRIQVWFQNRRARKNKKVIQEEENQLHYSNWPQSQIPQVDQVAQPETKRYRVENPEKYEDIYKPCTFPLQTRSHFYTNSLAGPQPFGYMWSTQRQPTSVIAPTCFLNSFNNTQPQLHQYMKQQLFPSGNLPYATSPLEAAIPRGSEYTSPNSTALEHEQSGVQEFSLQDILEEFQPCWTEAANNLMGASDDSLF